MPSSAVSIHAEFLELFDWSSPHLNYCHARGGNCVALWEKNKNILFPYFHVKNTTFSPVQVAAGRIPRGFESGDKSLKRVAAHGKQARQGRVEKPERESFRLVVRRLPPHTNHRALVVQEWRGDTTKWSTLSALFSGILSKAHPHSSLLQLSSASFMTRRRMCSGFVVLCLAWNYSSR